MRVDVETNKMFFDLILALSKEAAIQAHKFLQSHSLIRGYCKYPVRDIVFPKDGPQYSELYQKIPYLKYDIPQYELKDFPEDRIQYRAIFSGYQADRVNITELDGYEELFKYINNSTELYKLLIDEKNSDILEYRIKIIISDIVERYLYNIYATQDVPENLEDRLKPFILEKMVRYFAIQLGIDIYVPVCLVTFEDDTIKLSDKIEIIRIPEEIQKSRRKVCQYENHNEDSIAACATHMIVLRGYSISNDKLTSMDSALSDYHSYPLHLIDNIMVAIRIVTGYNTGYKQLLARPINWVDKICADLTPLYGAKSNFVNANEVEKFWMQLSISKISTEQALEIQKIFDNILLYEKDKTKGNLSFALKRLNRCMLREENDDMAIDAAIGLEALLSGGTKAEINYSISNRIPIVFKHEHNELYTPKVSRSIMRQIYEYRSKVVHGAIIKDKIKYYKINDKDIEIEEIAVEFLRYTLLFVLHNPEYLNVQKYDEFIDSMLSEE